MHLWNVSNLARGPTRELVSQEEQRKKALATRVRFVDRKVCISTKQLGSRERVLRGGGRAECGGTCTHEHEHVFFLLTGKQFHMS